MKNKIQLFLWAFGWCLFGMLAVSVNTLFTVPAVICGSVFGWKIGQLKE